MSFILIFSTLYKNNKDYGGRSIKVKVVKETSKSVTVEIVSLNRKMPVPKAIFEERVENGEYEVLNPEVLKANQED